MLFSKRKKNETIMKKGLEFALFFSFKQFTQIKNNDTFNCRLN